MLSEIGRCHSQSFPNILHDYVFEFVSPPSKCGGVGIFYKSKFTSINVEKNVISSNLNCHCHKCQVEDLWLDITCTNKLYKIIVCYRHPNGNVKHFNDALESSLMSVDSKPICILAGDLNIDLLKVNTAIAVNDYFTLMRCNLFTPAITIPTRITDTCTSLIDHIFIRLPTKYLSSEITSGNLYCDISDHLPNFCIISDTGEHRNASRPMGRIYNNDNFALFTQAIEYTDFSSVFSSSDVNIAYNAFLSKISTLHDTFFPRVKMSRKKSKGKPWVTAGIKKSIRHKNTLYRKFINNPTTERKASLTRYRRLLNKAIRYS